MPIRVRTPVDLGGVIRDHRTKLGLDQKTLAQKAGISRQWMVEIEKGNPGASIGLILRTIRVLGVSLAADDEIPPKLKQASLSSDSSIDIDSIVESARRKRNE